MKIHFRLPGWVKYVAGIGLLLLVGHSVGRQNLAETLSRFNYRALWLWLPLYFLNQFLGAVGLYVLFGERAPHFRRLLGAYVVSQNLGAFLPFQLGELSILYFLRRYG